MMGVSSGCGLCPWSYSGKVGAYDNNILFHLKGNWLSKRPELRSRLIIATKVWGPMDKNDLNARGLSRHHIMGAVEQSLQRLQTDYIDLYQVTTYICTSSN